MGISKKRTNKRGAKVLKQHTNRSNLIEQHKCEMEYIETTGPCTAQKTPDIKLPDDAPLDVRNRIQINDLLESTIEPIYGKFLLCRTICPPYKMTALMTVVDDPDGKLAAKIILYNFLPNVSYLNNKDAYPYLPVGSILAIIHPWVKTTAEGDVIINCYSPLHVVLLNPSKFHHIVGDVIWKGKIPSEFQTNKFVVDKKTALDWKKEGNHLHDSKCYRESIVAYTNGVNCERSKSNLWLDLVSNRSAAYLKLGNYNCALADAQSVLAVNKTHIKCIARRTDALFGLAQYEKAVSFLKNLPQDISDANRTIISYLIAKGERFVTQSQTGDYPFREVLGNEFPNYRHDIAQYTGPVVVKDSPNRGRGLFATETIKAGQLILACRAFASVVFEQVPKRKWYTISPKRSDETLPPALITAITQILTDCPEKCSEFYSLYGGDEYSNNKSSNRQALQVDEKRIRDICNYNAFGYGGFGETVSQNCITGIWILPSYINNNCIDANSVWALNADFMFVRAFHDIPKGAEIFICYMTPTESRSQSLLDRYGFACDCRLCKRDRRDDLKTQNFRAGLKAKLEMLLSPNEKNEINLDHRVNDEVTTILNLLIDSRRDAPELNILFIDQMATLALIDYSYGFYLKCAKSMECIFKITERIAAFFTFNLPVIVNLLLCYSEREDQENTTKWFTKLKEKSLLYYGSEDAIDLDQVIKYSEGNFIITT